MDPHLQQPYDQQFAFSIQHEIKGTIIEARYVGSHATKLLRGFDVNQEDVVSNGFLSDFLKAQQNGQSGAGPQRECSIRLSTREFQVASACQSSRSSSAAGI